MPKLKRIKFYTHHFVHTAWYVRKETTAAEAFLAAALSKPRHLIVFFGKLCFEICYRVGNGLVKGFLAFLSRLKWEIERTAASLKLRYQLFSAPQYAKTLVIFCFISLIGAFGFVSLRLVAQGLDVKGKVLGVMTAGSQHLADAKNELQNQNLQAAQNEFILAYQSFAGSRQEMESAGSILNGIMNLFPQKHDAENLAKAATLLSRSGTNLIEFYRSIEGLKISPEGISASSPVREIFSGAQTRLGQAISDLNAASSLIAEINAKNIPLPQQQPFLELKDKLTVLQKGISNFQGIFNLLQNFSLGRKNVLVLFENNNELRATGGFIGTYGNFQINDGKIENLAISSIYDLDGQLLDKIAPPRPVLNVNSQWFMRDSNWFANFPDSAKKASNFFEKEGGETPDVVIAVTPNLISDLLRLTGPVNLPNYKITLDSDNFLETMQVMSSVNYNKDLNQPKAVLADFFPALLQKISVLPANLWPALLEGLQSDLNAKHLAFYSRDPELQKQFEEFHWSGSLLSSDRDYLDIISSNLGGTKTDLYIDQSASLTGKIDEQGNITNELTITRTNRMPKREGTENISYIRIYVPLGSKLISNTGFDYKALNGAQPPTGQKNDPDVYEWEKSSVTDMVTGTAIGREAGKTFFGNWVALQGGETKTIKLAYTLPFRLNSIDRYSLLVQKQMGTLGQPFSFSLEFPGRKMEWQNFNPDVLDINKISLGLPLNKDEFFGIVFSKR
ncbi:MAG: DUF4012 domain-containing protein [Patescibacteria group bacterium]|nr:DUF4012 domain-containing protein [Patescibacteria group bacterium]